MTDDPNHADYWRHKGANTRYAARGVVDQGVRALLLEIADRYEAIGDAVAERGPITKVRRNREKARAARLGSRDEGSRDVARGLPL